MSKQLLPILKGSPSPGHTSCQAPTSVQAAHLPFLVPELVADPFQGQTSSEPLCEDGCLARSLSRSSMIRWSSSMFEGCPFFSSSASDPSTDSLPARFGYRLKDPSALSSSLFCSSREAFSSASRAILPSAPLSSSYVFLLLRTGVPGLGLFEPLRALRNRCEVRRILLASRSGLHLDGPARFLRPSAGDRASRLEDISSSVATGPLNPAPDKILAYRILDYQQVAIICSIPGSQCSSTFIRSIAQPTIPLWKPELPVGVSGAAPFERQERRPSDRVGFQLVDAAARLLSPRPGAGTASSR